MPRLIAASFLLLASSGFQPLAAAPGGFAGLSGAMAIAQSPVGCPPGWHRGPTDACRRDGEARAAPACPRGFHLGRGGRCRANRR